MKATFIKDFGESGNVYKLTKPVEFVREGIRQLTRYVLVEQANGCGGPSTNVFPANTDGERVGGLIGDRYWGHDDEQALATIGATL